jgi:hypothetical protein
MTKTKKIATDSGNSFKKPLKNSRPDLLKRKAKIRTFAALI